MFDFRTIGGKANITGALFISLALVLGLIGLWVSISFNAGQTNSARGTTIMRNLMTADMMHDALRGDVLNALLATNKDSQIATPQEVQADIKEHVKIFEAAFLEAKQQIKRPNEQQAIAAVEAPLKAYLNGATMVGDAIVSNPAAVSAEVPNFMKHFSTLEDAMEKMSGLVEEGIERDAVAAQNQARLAIVLVAIAIIGALILSFVVINASKKFIVKPLTDLTDAMTALANGRLDINPPHADSGGEIGALAAAMSTFRQNSIERQKLEQSEAGRAYERQKRAERIEELTDQFASAITVALTTLSSTSQELQANATQMGAMAAQTEALTNNAAHASSGVSEGVNSIASATTQLSATVDQISEQMQRSEDLAGNAAEVGKNTQTSIKELADAVNEISEVLALITNVSEQTNLLALNATIEAARAGEAGKGFAVVASEVKGLASQTAAATQDIAARIERVSMVSNHVTNSVNQVIKMVEQMHELTRSSSEAVNEQTHATSLIAQNAAQASDGTRSATEDVYTLSVSAKEAADASRSVSIAAQEVAKRADDLQKEANEFFTQIKAA